VNAADYLLEKTAGKEGLFVAGTKETISYKELHIKVNALSEYLRRDYGEGKEIMLLSQNSVFFIVSYLSILKSKNTVMLLETRISEQELKAVIDRCEIACACVDKRMQQKLISLEDKIPKEKIITESVLEALPQQKKEILTDNGDDDIAVVIFTSGSTGSKKGVMLTHKNIISNTESITQYLGLTEKDRIEVVLPFFYSYGLSLLNTHLRVGGSVVLNQSIFLGSVINEINQYKCTGFAGVPSTYQILISKTNFLKQEFPTLRYLTQAGGKLANKFIEEIIEAFPDKLFYVMYGATEATARLSYLPPQLVKKKLGSIGKGIPGVTLRIVDKNNETVKPGEVGEITAKGDNIMMGYYKDSENTNKTIKNRWLYTGDLATADEEGYIYVVGRSANIIKSAGYRISPSEVEEAINKIDKVMDCVVIGVPDDLMGEAVSALVLAREHTPELRKCLLEHCNRVLPSYKAPKYIIFVDEFPLNSSGKVSNQKIRELVESRIKNESGK
jgi:long-chain acyl-CoA synthetase